jgi:hypothetical protein
MCLAEGDMWCFSPVALFCVRECARDETIVMTLNLVPELLRHCPKARPSPLISRSAQHAAGDMPELLDVRTFEMLMLVTFL